MRNGYVGTGGFPPPGGPCAGVPGGLHPRTGLESPSDHVRPEGGAAGCTEGPDSPSEVGCGRCARTGALHPGRSVAHGGPAFGLGRRAGPRGLRACAGGLGGRRGPRTALGWWPRLSSPGEQTSEGRQFTLSTGAVPRSPAPPAAPSPARPADASRGRPRGPTPPLRRCQVPWGWKSRPRRRRTRGLTGLQAPEPDGARGGDRRGRRPLSRAWLHLLRVHLLARQAVASPRLVPRNVSLQDGWGPSVVSPPADSGHGAPRGSAGAGGAVP